MLKTAPLLHRLSGALPMATPHHRTFPTEEQRRRRPQRALRHRTRLQRPPAPDSFHNLHAAACAVLCGGTPRACPQPLWSWRRANPGSAAAQQHGALLSSGCVLPELAFLTARPPARPSAWRTLRHTHTHAHTQSHSFFSMAGFYGEKRDGVYDEED